MKASEIKTLYRKAIRLNADGEFQASLDMLDRTIRLAPEMARGHYLTGVTLLALKRPEDAVAEFETAIKMEPYNLDFPFGLALTRWRLGDHAAAIEISTDAIGKDKERGDYHGMRGYVFADTQNIECPTPATEWLNPQDLSENLLPEATQRFLLCLSYLSQGTSVIAQLQWDLLRDIDPALAERLVTLAYPDGAPEPEAKAEAEAAGE